MKIRAVLTGCLVGWLAALPVPGATDFVFEDNLKEALAGGQRNLASGQLEDAEVDFENALTLDPSNVDAMEKLFEIFSKMGRKLQAEGLLQRMRESGKLPDTRLSELGRQAAAIVAGTRSAAARTAARTGTAPADAGDAPGVATSPVSASSGAGKDVASLSTDDLSDALAEGLTAPAAGATGPGGGSDDGLGELEKELTHDLAGGSPKPGTDAGSLPAEGGGKRAVAPPKGFLEAVSGSAAERAAKAPDRDPSKLSPDEKFEASLELAKKKDFQKAIPLYVSALQAKNSLLARDDFGLRAISQSYYESRIKSEPANPQMHFMLGWFAELDSRNDDALEAYRQVVKTAKPTDDLHNFAKLKVEQIEALRNSLVLAQKAEAQKREEAAKKTQLSNITQGKLEGLKGGDYLKKGNESFERWKKDKSATSLEEAMAYFEGALVVDGNNPKTHLEYAKVKIDQAIAGDPTAKETARKELETAMLLKPDSDTRKQIQSLLDGLGSSKQTAAAK